MGVGQTFEYRTCREVDLLIWCDLRNIGYLCHFRTQGGLYRAVSLKNYTVFTSLIHRLASLHLIRCSHCLCVCVCEWVIVSTFSIISELVFLHRERQKRLSTSLSWKQGKTLVAIATAMPPQRQSSGWDGDRGQKKKKRALWIDPRATAITGSGLDRKSCRSVGILSLSPIT